jgi:predicted GNAT family N-acyltransferase
MIDSLGTILGFYTLSAFSIKASELPDGVARKLPRYPLLPATLLGRLAVSKSHQGMGVGCLLLLDALERSFANASKVASVAIVVDAIDENARAFYSHHEFVQLRDRPNSLFLSMATIEKAKRPR